MRRAGTAARAVAVVVGVVVAGLVTFASPAAAHPLGRFTVNQSAALRVSPSAVDVDYVVDMAELPAFQAREDQVDADRDGTVSDAESERYAVTACATAAGLMRLTVDDRAVPLVAGRSTVTYPPGEGGLPTLRLECALRGEVAAAEVVAFLNEAYPDRTGWREVIAAGDGVELTSSDVPQESASGRLRSYPEDPLSATSDVRAASLRARPCAAAQSCGTGLPAASPVVAAADRLTAAFSSVVDRQRLTVGVGLLGILLAVVLGAAHAIAPGHGKTVMAAVLVGQRGSWRQAAVIALSVTVTHTAGVLVLGAALAASLTFAPERVYGLLSGFSGVLLAVVGFGLLRRAWRGRKEGFGHHHSHGPGGHSHGPGGHSHDHGPGDHGHHHGPVRQRTLLALGFAGGLLPSPSAIVVLLGAVALGRPWYGVLLVTAYGLGMATTLISIGLALSRWAPALTRRLPRRLTRWQPALPVLTSTVIVLVGVTLTTQAILTQS